MSKRCLVFIVLMCMIMLSATELVSAGPTFKGSPAACAWYTNTGIDNPYTSERGFSLAARYMPIRDESVYDTVDIFLRANDNSLLHYHWIPNPASIGYPGFMETVLPGQVIISSSPAVVQRRSNLIDVFARDAIQSNALWHLAWDGSEWSSESLALQGNAGPHTEFAASSWGPDRIDLFMNDSSDYVEHRSMNGAVWDSNWEVIGSPPVGRNLGGAASGPAAGSWGPHRVDVVVRGLNNAYYYNWYDISGWNSEWLPLGGGFTSKPFVDQVPLFPGSLGSQGIGVGGRGLDGAIWVMGYHPDGTKSDWGNVGGQTTSSAAGVNYIGDHVTDFVRWIDNTLWYLDYDLYCCHDTSEYVWKPMPDLPYRAPGQRLYYKPTSGPALKLKNPFMLENNTNRPGWDYKDFDLKEADPNLCAQACTDDAQCKAFTYIKPGYQGPNARCWLKNNITNPVPAECCISGVKGGETVLASAVIPEALHQRQVVPTQEVSMTNDTDRPGSDYKDFDLKEADPNLCAQACTDDAQCKAFTYIKPGYQGPSARCWLKNNITNPVPAECCISGVKGKDLLASALKPEALEQPQKLPQPKEYQGE